MKVLRLLAVLMLPFVFASSAMSEGENESFKDYRYKGTWNGVDRTEWDWTMRIQGDGNYILYTGDPEFAGIAATGGVTGIGGSGGFTSTFGAWNQDPTYAGGAVPGTWSRQGQLDPVQWISNDSGAHSIATLCELEEE